MKKDTPTVLVAMLPEVSDWTLGVDVNEEEPNYEAFRNVLQPLATITKNNGFQTL